MRVVQQPRQIVPINWGHPLARDLRLFVVFIGNVAVDLVTGRVGVPSGSATIEALHSRTAAKLDSAGSEFYAWDDDDRHDILDDITLAWRGRVASGLGYRHFAGKHASNGTSANPFDFRTDNAASPKPSLVRANAGTFLQWDSGTALTVGSTQTVEVTQHIGEVAKFYVDGIAASTTGASPGVSATNSSTGLRIGRRADGAVQMDGYTEYVVGWATARTAEELAAFRANPYALTLARSRRVARSRVALASSGATLTVDAGTLTLAGQSLLLAQSVAVGSGSVTLAGQSATFARSAAVTAGTLALGGQTVTLPQSLAVTSGTVTLTGQSVALNASASVTLTADAGALTLSGQSVTLTASGSVTLVASHGALALAGQSVTLVATSTAVPTRMQFSLSRRRAVGTYSCRSAAYALARRSITFALNG